MYSCVKAWIAHIAQHAEHAGISHRCRPPWMERWNHNYKLV